MGEAAEAEGEHTSMGEAEMEGAAVALEVVVVARAARDFSRSSRARAKISG